MLRAGAKCVSTFQISTPKSPGVTPEEQGPTPAAEEGSRLNVKPLAASFQSHILGKEFFWARRPIGRFVVARFLTH